MAKLTRILTKIKRDARKKEERGGAEMGNEWDDSNSKMAQCDRKENPDR